MCVCIIYLFQLFFFIFGNFRKIFSTGFARDVPDYMACYALEKRAKSLNATHNGDGAN